MFDLDKFAKIVLPQEDDDEMGELKESVDKLTEALSNVQEKLNKEPEKDPEEEPDPEPAAEE